MNTITCREYEMGRMYENGIDREKNIKEAIYWYSLASDNGYQCADYKLMKILTKEN